MSIKETRREVVQQKRNPVASKEDSNVPSVLLPIIQPQFDPLHFHQCEMLRLIKIIRYAH